MSATSRGIRNAFRNNVRTVSIVAILGLSLSLALSMLLAHQAVDQKINSVKSSVGNTINIAPAGFSGFNQVSNALTTSQLSKVQSLPHVSSLVENLDDRLTTVGSVSSPSGQQGSSATTSLTSPVTLNSSGNGTFGGGGFRLRTESGSLPSNFSLPISVLGTNDPTQLNSSNLKLASGSFINGNNNVNQALVSTGMASKNNLKVGSTFTAYNTTITVAGIFDSSTQADGGTVIMSLPTVESLSGNSGDVTSAVATVDSVDNLASVTSAIKSTLGSNADITNSQDEANNTIQPLQNIKSISLYSLIGAVVAGAVIIFLTMLMIVRERRVEIGVTKAIGASNLKIMWQFMAEAITLTVLAAVVGIIIGVVAANPITKTLVNNASTSNNTSTSSSATNGAGPGTFRTFGGGGGGGAGARGPGGANFVNSGRGLGVLRSNLTNIHAAVGWSILAYGLGAALLIALIGSGVASWSIAKVRPAEVIRAG